MDVKKIVFDIKGDDRGKLVPLEENGNIPFDIKRVYYIYDTLGDVIRGKHAHKSLQQVLLCVSGSCTIMLDDGRDKVEIELNKPNEGIYISSNIWREMYNFSKDAVLMVLASEHYNEEDYIRNYDEFIKYVSEK